MRLRIAYIYYMSNGADARTGETEMTRTTITKTGTNEVTLTAIDPLSGDEHTRVFWIPTNGGYVREGAHHTANDRQVCLRLTHRGNTLKAVDADDLLAVIRAEWKVYRKWAMVA